MPVLSDECGNHRHRIARFADSYSIWTWLCLFYIRISIYFDFVPGYSSRDAYMLSEVSMPVGQSVCKRDRISARSSCNNGWILEGKLLIGATITRWDAGTIF